MLILLALSQSPDEDSLSSDHIRSMTRPLRSTQSQSPDEDSLSSDVVVVAPPMSEKSCLNPLTRIHCLPT